jgi:signal transduction histidine kinase
MADIESRREGALVNVIAGFASAATRDEILRVVLVEGGRAVGSSVAVAYRLGEDKRSVVLAAHQGLTAEVVRAVQGATIDSNLPVARCLRDGQPIWISSREALARDFPGFEAAVGCAFERQSVVALPLRVRGELVAGIGFAFAEAHPFDEAERAFLRTLAERCESAMERALLYEESQAARAAAEQSRAETEALLRFSEMMSGILAHDLRNPLAAVLMNARLLRNAEGERERTIATRIIASGERMTRMIDQILDWSRVRSAAGHVQLVRSDCDLAKIAEQVVGEHQARAADVPIAFEPRGDLGGKWDADRLAQMLSNLVGNALDHAIRPGVRLLVDGESAADAVTITVENHGAIEDEVMPLIFEPFRGRASGSRLRGRGLGLGLYITRQIVIAHGGRIDVAQPPEERVVFTVTLPRDAAAA